MQVDIAPLNGSSEGSDDVLSLPHAIAPSTAELGDDDDDDDTSSYLTSAAPASLIDLPGTLPDVSFGTLLRPQHAACFVSSATS